MSSHTYNYLDGKPAADDLRGVQHVMSRMQRDSAHCAVQQNAVLKPTNTSGVLAQ
jgi:hypothetical protein